MTPDRTAAAIQARRRATEQKLQQVRDAVASLKRRKTPVTYPAVARQAGVSRTFLYANPDARALISDAVSKPGGPKAAAHEGSGDHDLPWRERALNAEAALTAAHAEITAQRHRMAILLGQVRDLEHDLSPQAAQRLASENTTLKHRVRELTSDNKTLEERLEAARSNNRFADRRIAQLEAQLAERVPAR
jgi:Family of unknown function (DUF6262)